MPTAWLTGRFAASPVTLTEAVDNGCWLRLLPIVDSRHRRMLLSFDLERCGPGYAGQPLRARPAGSTPSSTASWSRLSRKGGPLFCYLGFDK